MTSMEGPISGVDIHRLNVETSLKLLSCGYDYNISHLFLCSS